MSVRIEGERVRLEGDCGAADAEALCAALAGGDGRVVEVSAAGRLHTAVVQALVALRPTVSGKFSDPFLGRYVTALFQGDPTPDA
jgi:hypothetical protein